MKRREAGSILSEYLLPPLIEIVEEYHTYSHVFLSQCLSDVEDDEYKMIYRQDKLYLLGSSQSYIFKNIPSVPDRNIPNSSENIPNWKLIRTNKKFRGNYFAVDQNYFYATFEDHIRIYTLSKKKRSLLKRWHVPFTEKEKSTISLTGIAVFEGKKSSISGYSLTDRVIVVDSKNCCLHFFTREGIYLFQNDLPEFKDNPEKIIAINPNKIVVYNKDLAVTYEVDNSEVRCLRKFEFSFLDMSVSSWGDLYSLSLVSPVDGMEIHAFKSDYKFLGSFYLKYTYEPRSIVCGSYDQIYVLDQWNGLHCFERDIWDEKSFWHC